MISRRTATILGENYVSSFALGELVKRGELYDFLFDHEFEPWFCNLAQRVSGPRALKEFVMRLHTGETLAETTKEWTWAQRQQLGQTYLVKLASDIMTHEIGWVNRDRTERARRELEARVVLDGYKFVDGRLIPTEADILDSEEQVGLLEMMFKKLGLGNAETAMHCLRLSEQHWIDSKWDDCISNARRFLESTLQEVAATYASAVQGRPLSTNVYSKAFAVRDFLESEGLIERQEKATIKEVYGLLSAKGSHPNIAARDQARLLRQVALIFAYFVMLRLEHALTPP